MAEKRMDQRVRVTKELLQEALIRLLKDQPISKISVRALCQEAGINRSTFYAHYQDPTEVLNEIEATAMKKIQKQLSGHNFVKDSNLPLSVLTESMTYIKENAALFSVLMSDNCNRILQQDVSALVHRITAVMSFPYSEDVLTYATAFWISGAVEIAEMWLASGTKESPEEISCLILHLIYDSQQHIPPTLMS